MGEDAVARAANRAVNDGGQAFPNPSAPGGPEGMSLFEWYAGQALAGLTAAATSPEYVLALCNKAQAFGISEEDYTARMSYALAEAMMKKENRPS